MGAVPPLMPSTGVAEDPRRRSRLHEREACEGDERQWILEDENRTELSVCLWLIITGSELSTVF